MTQAVEAPRTAAPRPPASNLAPAEERSDERTQDAVKVVRTVPVRLPAPEPERAVEARRAAESEAPSKASRPADPGTDFGEGIDVAFVFTPYTSDKAKLRRYSRLVRKYLMTVRPERMVLLVDDLDEMVARLGYIAQGGNRIRRLRIVAHGWEGGRVLTHVPEDAAGRGGAQIWLTPEQVEAYGKRPDVREVMQRALMPKAVVEFWGCRLGQFERGGQAWSDLFGRTLLAPVGYFGFLAEELWVRVRHHDPKRTPLNLKIGELKGFRHPGGPWVYRRVRRSSDARRWGSMAVADFEEQLMVLYRTMRMQGLVPDYSKEPDGELGAMRRLFDEQGGTVIQLGPEREPEDKERPFITADKPAWKSAWRPFTPTRPEPPPPVTEKEAAPPVAEKESVPPPAPKEPTPAVPPPGRAAAEKEPPPPTAEKAAVPPAAEKGPVPPVAEKGAAPPVVEKEPVPPAVEKEPAPPAPAPPVPAPPALEPAISPARRLPPPAPAAISPETEWARRHPEGRVTKVGHNEWLLWNFGIGSARVKPQHARAFEEIAAELASAPGTLQVTGLASASGSVLRNQRLSIARARSVEAMLSVFNIHPTLATVSGFGECPPRTDPEGAARDRAVAIRVPARSRRKPLSPTEEAIDWRISQPSPPAQKPEPPPAGFTYKEKLWKFKKNFPLGVDWILVGEVELGYQIDLFPGTPVNVAVAFDKGVWDGELKVALSESVELKGTLKDATISVTFRDVPLKPEVKVGLGDLLENAGKLGEMLRKDPISMLKLASVKFTIPLPKWTEIDLGTLVPELAGVHGKLKPNVKVAVSLAPSPVLLARLGATIGSRVVALGGAAAPVVVGIVGGIAWTILSLYLINLAHRRGENWAHVVNLRRGYALRLAAEAADWRSGELRGSGSTQAWDEARRTIGNVLPPRPDRLTEQQQEPFKATYAQLYEGWEAAGKALDGLKVAEYDQIMQRLRQLAGRSLDELTELIFRRLGGISEKETSLDVEWLRTR
jgi:outer membrane protein OmpA-like peptidoglycan-associated protein